MSKSPWIREPYLSLICASYEAGQKVEAIAANFGVHPSTVKRIARRKGAKIRPIGRSISVRDSEIVADYLSGISAAEVAGTHRCSCQTVYNAVRRLGEAVRPRWGRT